MKITFPIEMSIEEMARNIADLDPPSILELIAHVLDLAAVSELDEELIARTWIGLQGCYEQDEQPTLEEIVKKYEAQSRP